MISFSGVDVTRYEILITRHALLRAEERGIQADTIEATIRGGRVTRHSKDGVTFTKKGKRSIACVGRITGENIIILTVKEE